jgi:hypothetical protein
MAQARVDAAPVTIVDHGRVRLRQPDRIEELIMIGRRK